MELYTLNKSKCSGFRYLFVLCTSYTCKNKLLQNSFFLIFEPRKLNVIYSIWNKKITCLLPIISIWQLWSLESCKIFSEKRLKQFHSADDTREMTIRHALGRDNFWLADWSTTCSLSQTIQNNECFLRKKR